MTFGEFVKILRSEQRLGLREFCVRYEHDPSNWSKIERGVIPPPKDLGLQEKLAAQLGLEPGTERWNEFFDLASAANCMLPYDLRDSQVIEMLPLIFRTVRGTKPTEDELRRVISHIKAHG